MKVAGNVAVTCSGIVTGASTAMVQTSPRPVQADPQSAWSEGGPAVSVTTASLRSRTEHVPTHDVPGGAIVTVGFWAPGAMANP